MTDRVQKQTTVIAAHYTLASGDSFKTDLGLLLTEETSMGLDKGNAPVPVFQ